MDNFGQVSSVLITESDSRVFVRCHPIETNILAWLGLALETVELGFKAAEKLSITLRSPVSFYPIFTY